MIRFLFIFLLPFTLYGSKILSYNIYDRTDRVDVMITFDTPYEGSIKQNQSASNIIIKLEDASIESAKVKKLSSKFLSSLNISPMAGYTQITANTPPSVELKVSKTSDSYGLRLRFVAQTVQSIPQAAPQVQKATQATTTSSLPTKKDDDLSSSYYIVIAILILGIIILLYIKTRVTPKKQKNSWLFNPNNEAQKDKQPLTDKDGVSIRFQKSIRESDTVVMLDYLDQSYLVLMGSNNILLDKFTDDKPTTQDEFEQILQNRHQQLDEYLQVQNQSTSTPKQAFDSYREKASSISYDV